MASALRRDPKCQTRNYRSALLDRAECSPIRWLSAEDFRAATAEPATDRPRLPADINQALAKINAGLETALAEEEIYVHNLEGASTSYISDRYMFLHKSTLNNIVDYAANKGGFAFMNSHRTGRLSSASELPFGRAFAGQISSRATDSGGRVKTALLSIYMLRGMAPNGANGPTTDTLSKSIKGGTIFDVSMGLSGGQTICDVCGNDLYGTDEEGRFVCKHYPGTHRKMSPEQIQTQADRGVPGGIATYSLVDATPGEVSAVYDGAIPGAGFAKAHQLLRTNSLGAGELDQLFGAYPLLEQTKRGWKMAGNSGKRTITLGGLAQLLTGRPAHLAEPDDEIEVETDGEETTPGTFSMQERHAPAAPQSPPAQTPQEIALQARIASLEAKEDNTTATNFAKDALFGKKIVSAEQAPLQALALAAVTDDRRSPLPDGKTRLSLLDSFIKMRTPHTLGVERVVSDANRPGVREASGTEGAPANLNATPSDPAGDPEDELANEDERSAREYAARRYPKAK